MKSELIVDVQSKDIAIALTEDERLMEWGQESKTEVTYAVGNIYYGRVKKIMPALNAVFVDVGYEKEAFLHYLDLGSQFLTLEKFTQFAVKEKNKKPLMSRTPDQKEVTKQGNIQDVCRVGQEILVQVTKEPINTKGPRLTAEISLAGRNIVLIPFGDKVMVSSKIKSEAERSRLKQLVQAIKPEKFGVIVRTVAEGKRAAEIDAELRLLLKRWEETVARLQKAKPVSLVAEEIGRTIGVIRDVFTPDFTSIFVNDQQMFEEVKSYVGLIAPESEKIVKLYKGDQPIFDHFGITRQMKTGLGRTVGFKNGGYLIMERTEALYSIDVNSGSKKLGTDQEDNAFQCNMLAADEIYHQLRLRDIGGIIIVDFIDMDSAEHRQLLFEHMRRLMKRDRARHNVLQLSKFGLMQITRQRVRPVVEVDVQEVCPTCGGKGKIQPSLLFTDMLDEQIELYVQHFGRGLKLYVHPFVYAYATQGFFFTSLRFKWFRSYGIRLIADESLPMLEYRFVGKDGKTVELPRMTELSTEGKAAAKAALYTARPIEEKPEVRLPKQADEPTKQNGELAAQAKDADAADSSKKKSRKRKQKADAKVAEASEQKSPAEQLPAEAEDHSSAAADLSSSEGVAAPSKKRNRRKQKNAKAEQAVSDAESLTSVGNASSSDLQEPVEPSVQERPIEKAVADAPSTESEGVLVESEDSKAKSKARSRKKSAKKKATPSDAASDVISEASTEDNASQSAADASEKQVAPKKKARRSSKKAQANASAAAADGAEQNASSEEGAPKQAPRKRAPRRKPAKPASDNAAANAEPAKAAMESPKPVVDTTSQSE